MISKCYTNTKVEFETFSKIQYKCKCNEGKAIALAIVDDIHQSWVSVHGCFFIGRAVIRDIGKINLYVLRILVDSNLRSNKKIISKFSKIFCVCNIV